MTPRIRHVWTEAEKARALEVYRTQGQAAACRTITAEVGVTLHRGTMYRWALAAGVKTEAVDTAGFAREVMAAKRAVLREELHALLLEKAVGLMRRIDEPHVDYKSAGALGPVQVTYPVAPAAACQHYATSVGILIDKLRLEEGLPTGREEHRHEHRHIETTELDREIDELLAEMGARAQGEAEG